MYMVITEIVNPDKTSRWYYGQYKDSNKANEVAISLGNEYPVFHSVIPSEQAAEFGVLNLP